MCLLSQVYQTRKCLFQFTFLHLLKDNLNLNQSFMVRFKELFSLRDRIILQKIRISFTFFIVCIQRANFNRNKFSFIQNCDCLVFIVTFLQLFEIRFHYQFVVIFRKEINITFPHHQHEQFFISSFKHFVWSMDRIQDMILRLQKYYLKN